MKIRAFRPELASVVADAARAIPLRPPLPVLNCVRITATDDGQVEVVGYDFDVCLRATLTADVLEAGQVLVPGRVLAGMLAGMPDGTIDLVHDGARLALTMPRMRGGLRTVAADNYPALPAKPPTVGTLPVDELARVLGKVIVAARPLIGLEWSGAVQLIATADRLTVTATDRHTIGIAGTAWDGPAEPMTVEVSGKALGDALRTMTGDVSLCIGDTGFGVLGASREFTSRRLATEYPGLLTFVDRLPESTTRILMRADELADTMARGARVVTEDRKPVSLTATPGEGLTYLADAEGESDVAGDLDVEEITGEPVTFGVNPQYLAGAVKPLGSSLIELGVRGPRKPVSVTNPETPGDIHLVQPIVLK